MTEWFKLWASDFCDDFHIDVLENELDSSERQNLIADVGRAFVNGMNYYYMRYMEEDDYKAYPLITSDGKRLFRKMRAWIDKAFEDYEKKVENGKKGGRPKKEDAQQTPQDDFFHL